MVVPLLVLIVLVLLFGAGAVKGWIGRVFASVIGFAALCALLGMVSSVIGGIATAYAAMGLGVAIIMVRLSVRHLQDRPRREAMIREAALQMRREEIAQRKTKLKRHSHLPKIERLWHHLAPQIASFPAEAQTTAKGLYAANNVDGLRQFCRDQLARSSEEKGAPG